MSSPGLAVSAWAGISFNRIIFLQTAFTTWEYLFQELRVQKSWLEGVIRVATNPGIKLTESRLPYHFSHLPSDARACSQLVDMLAFSCLGFTVRIQRPMQRLKLFVELEGFVRMITWGNLRSERDLFSFSLHQKFNTPLTWMQGSQSLTRVYLRFKKGIHCISIVISVFSVYQCNHPMLFAVKKPEMISNNTSSPGSSFQALNWEKHRPTWSETKFVSRLGFCGSSFKSFCFGKKRQQNNQSDATPCPPSGWR